MIHLSMCVASIYLFLVFQRINSDQRYIYESIWTYVRSFSISILSVSEQIKNFLTAHKHFHFLMPKRRNKRINEQSNSAASQSEDKNYDSSQNENHEKIDPAEVNNAKQLLLEKMTIFKLTHENECADGKASSNETRMESSNEIQTLFDKIGHKTSLD